MKPTIGRDVHVMNFNSNGSSVQAAKITRIWADHDPSEGPVRVNLVVFPDSAPPCTCGSVLMFDSEQAATEYLDLQAKAGGTQAREVVAYWPTHV